MKLSFNPKEMNGLRFEANHDAPFITKLRTIAEQPLTWLFRLKGDGTLHQTFIISLEQLRTQTDTLSMKVWGWIGEFFPDISTMFASDNQNQSELERTQFLFIEFTDRAIVDESIDETNLEFGINPEEDLETADPIAELMAPLTS